MPIIYGQRVMLREYRKEDLPFMRAWVNDPEIVDNLADIFLHPHTVQETENFLQSILAGQGLSEKHFVFAAKDTEEYIGQIDLINIDWKNRAGQMGIVLGRKELLNKGLGAEAIRLLQQYVFETLNLNRLELYVYDYNQRAYHCYLKCGFVEEGRLRQRFYAKGLYHDTIQMGILKEEYLKLKS